MAELNPKNIENTEEIQIKNPPVSQQDSRSKSFPFWRLLVPLLFQLVLIASVPAQAVYTYVTGKTVILQTTPVDPYDFLRGYYQTLNYEISSPETLKTLPGWQEIAGEDDYLSAKTTIYVTLEQPKTESNSESPLAWKPIKISLETPESLPDNQIAIRGESQGWNIKYGLERYYMPENQREQINQDINETQLADSESFVVEVKVDDKGKAIPISLWVSDRHYQF